MTAHRHTPVPGSDGSDAPLGRRHRWRRPGRRWAGTAPLLPTDRLGADSAAARYTLTNRASSF